MNNSHVCEFNQRIPLHSAQTLEVKGDISLESAQVQPGMGGYPHMGMNVPFVQPPSASFGGAGAHFNVNFGFPSAPSVPPVPSYSVSFVIFSIFNDY